MEEACKIYINKCKKVNKRMESLANELVELEKLIALSKEKFGKEFVEFASTNEELIQLDKDIIKHSEVIENWV